MGGARRAENAVEPVAIRAADALTGKAGVHLAFERRWRRLAQQLVGKPSPHRFGPLVETGDRKAAENEPPMSSAARSSRSSFARYLHSLALRREIHEGLNTIERWNGANDFVYFARRGEMTSNRREDQEISMLSLHLLQNCMVYVNTLMLQEVLAEPHWQGRLTETDLRALTPLTWEHINPYGRFELDMTTRLPLTRKRTPRASLTIGLRPLTDAH